MSPQKTPKKLRKMKPYTGRWEKMANEEARIFAPEIKACRNCGRPVVDGYSCRHCGEGDP